MLKTVPRDAILPPTDAKRVFEGAIFDIYQWQQPMFDGSTQVFEMTRRADTVQVLAIVGGKVLLLEDEQPHVGMRITLPGGRVDAEDASIMQAAQREAREETGYTFKRWRLVNVTQPVRKMEWFIHTFVAWDTNGRIATKLDGGEKITLQPTSLEKLKDLAEGDVFLFPEIRLILRAADTVETLESLPHFAGKQVDR